MNIFSALACHFFVIGRAKAFSVAHNHAQALALYQHGRAAHAGAQVCPRHNNHRGLKPLGFVDGHNAHGVHVFGHGHFFFAAFGAPVLKKGGQGGKALFFRTVQHFHKAPQKGFRLGVAPRHIHAGVPFKRCVVGRHKARLAVERRKQTLPELRPAVFKTLEHRPAPR